MNKALKYFETDDFYNVRTAIEIAFNEGLIEGFNSNNEKLLNRSKEKLRELYDDDIRVLSYYNVGVDNIFVIQIPRLRKLEVKCVICPIRNREYIWRVIGIIDENSNTYSIKLMDEPDDTIIQDYFKDDVIWQNLGKLM